uniref:EGF-like domain-containing protein n=1 Tax=Syphacia muris TaxID=451379 RepID=A0A158R5S5_9BILA
LEATVGFTTQTSTLQSERNDFPEQNPVAYVPSTFVVHVNDLSNPGSLVTATFYENFNVRLPIGYLQVMVRPQKLSTRYNCGYEYYAENFYCTNSSHFYYKLDGIDFYGNKFRRVGGFECKGTCVAPPTASAAPAPVECQNNGVLMTDTDGTKYCYCNGLFHGRDCSKILCMNGGTGLNEVCLCPTGFSGDHCQDGKQFYQKLLYLKNPALGQWMFSITGKANTACSYRIYSTHDEYDMFWGFSPGLMWDAPFIQPVEGQSYRFLEHPTVPPPTDCMNGGVELTSSDNKTSCLCRPDWTGSKCEDAVCHNGAGGHWCQCPSGFNGEHCEIEVYRRVIKSCEQPVNIYFPVDSFTQTIQITTIGYNNQMKVYRPDGNNKLNKTYEMWDNNEPSSEATKNCVVRGTNGKWKMADCSEDHFYICQRHKYDQFYEPHIKTDPVPADFKWPVSGCEVEVRVQSSLQVFPNFVLDQHSDIANEGASAGSGKKVQRLLSATYEKREMCVYPWLTQNWQCPDSSRAIVSVIFILECHNGFPSAGECVCMDYWAGVQCDTPQCVNGGSLDSENNVCKCPDGYIGDACQYAECLPQVPATFSTDGKTFVLLVELTEPNRAAVESLVSNVKSLITDVITNHSGWFSNILLLTFNSQQVLTNRTYETEEDFIFDVEQLPHVIQDPGTVCGAPLFEAVMAASRSSAVVKPNSILLTVTRSVPNDYSDDNRELLAGVLSTSRLQVINNCVTISVILAVFVECK